MSLILALAVGACSPAFDWRETRPPDAGVELNLPCKPSLQSRRSPTGLRMGLARCEAGGEEFALSWAELPEPAAAGSAMAQMHAALLRQLGGQPSQAEPFAVSGMTPSPEAVMQRVDGASHARLAVFNRGLKVYQLVVRSDKPIADAHWNDFASSVRLID
ncbi:MAG: hypothetical protein JO006_16735 [Paucibacter sp.]|nr:hypothetical protein [Roseateles sp.]